MRNAETLQEARSAFVRAVEGSPHAEGIISALDDVLAWSAKQVPTLTSLSAGDQATVGVGLTADSDVLWRAYPRQRDGAKIVVLPGTFDALGQDAQAALRAAFDEAVPGGEFASAGYLQGSLTLLADDVVRWQFRVALAAALAALKAHRLTLSG